MSLARLVLRSLVCNALSRQTYDADDVTMAGDKVFDSRLDPLQFDRNKSEIPSILVYTDEDEHLLLNRSANAGPYMRHVDVRIEIGIGSFASVTYRDADENKQGIAQVLPTIDSELEARLDLFEQQVHWALRYLGTSRAATAAFMSYVVATESITSEPFRDEGGNNRLALRRIRYRCRINDDCPPPRVLDVNVGTLPAKRVLVGEDFPVSDWLRPMLVSLQSAPSMQRVISALAGDTSQAEVVPLLKRLGVTVDCIQPADPNLLQQLNRTRGPDGRVEYYALWELP